MKSFIVFTGKEMKEHARTYRAVVLGAVLLLFGMMSPATAKFTPEILQFVGGDAGMRIELPPVTVLDSYMQFFKNMNSMGVILLLLLFAGSIAGEKARGSAALMFARGLSRPAFVLSKFAAAATLWTAAYALSVFACLGYTSWLFPGELAGPLPLAFAAYWLYVLMLLSFTVLSGALARGQAMASLGAFALWGLTMLSTVPYRWDEASPAALGLKNLEMVSGALTAADLPIPALLAVLAIAAALAMAVFSMKRQEL